ncbi:uncharacterized protein LOC105662768 [Megachile rotundata]|uniref:uncharacterized protein LOC105662768 n=1 Tax=Megachile rotundata TaxID=143995 RepID=UPI003FD20BAE
MKNGENVNKTDIFDSEEIYICERMLIATLGQFEAKPFFEKKSFKDMKLITYRLFIRKVSLRNRYRKIVLFHQGRMEKILVREASSFHLSLCGK